ncbi:MAG TPA: hypothetical protein VKA08_07115 [Balneolales bacterium]|nr:hypothetical protein [Balneolales bacterium]
MKHFPIYVILIITIILVAGCDIFSSGNPQNPGLKGKHVTGIYANMEHIVVGTENYLFLSVDNGSSWRLVDTTSVRSDSTSGSLPPNNLGFIGHTTLFGSGSFIFAGVNNGLHGGILISTNNGRTWTERDTSFNKGVNCFTKINETVFAGTDHGVFLSSNNGKSWKAADISGMSYQIHALASLGTNLFAGTSFNGVYRSTNNGSSWSSVSRQIENMSIYSLSVIDSSLFAGTYSDPSAPLNGVLLSTDGGNSWKVVNGNTAGTLYPLGPDLFASISDKTYFSTNDGNSWALLDSVRANCFATNNSYLFIGTNEGIKRYPLSLFNK